MRVQRSPRLQLSSDLLIASKPFKADGMGTLLEKGRSSTEGGREGKRVGIICKFANKFADSIRCKIISVRVYLCFVF